MGLALFQVAAAVFGPLDRPLPERATQPVVRVATPGAMPDGGRPFTVASSDTLLRLYERASFDLDAVRAGAADVPRLYLTALPGDFDALGDVEARKRTFLRVALPLVLRVNTEIEITRTRVAGLLDRLAAGTPLRRRDARWLMGVARQYGVVDTAGADPVIALDAAARRTLLRRVQGVPVPLALAQAIVESGWGRSRFALEGNALYGQWTWDRSQGIAPSAAPDAAHAVRSFDSLLGSVRGYMHNLNTHPGYREFRAARAEGASARTLALTLTRYSERGAVYGEDLVAIIAQNDLDALGDAKLGATNIRRGGGWDALKDVPQS
jgi:Bax protein